MDFSVTQSLDCKKGGLVIARHNELRDGVADLACKYLISNHMRGNTLITPGRTMSIGKAMQAGNSVTNKQPGTAVESEQKGGLISKDLWEKVTDCVLNILVVNTDTKSYQLRPMYKCLTLEEQDKKRKYIESFLQQRYHLSPFVVSVDGLLRVESKATLKQLAS